MIIGKVIGTIWGAKKAQYLEGLKLLQIRPLELIDDSSNKEKKRITMKECNLSKSILIAADTLGAGIGEYVIVSTGTRVRNIVYGTKPPVKSIVIGIVDSSDFLME